jgi:hypothetical protein
VQILFAVSKVFRRCASEVQFWTGLQAVAFASVQWLKNLHRVMHMFGVMLTLLIE